MKRVATLCLLGLLAFAALAAANPVKGPWGPLVPSPDPSSSHLMICDTAAGMLNIYVVLHYTGYGQSGVTGVQFSAPKPSCFTGVYLSDTHMFPVWIGNSQTGVAIAFGSCLTPPVHVMTMTYFALGTTAADCVYLTLPDPNNPAGRIEIADCDFNVFQIADGGNFINAPEAACGTNPTETMTWGRVKALFTE